MSFSMEQDTKEACEHIRYLITTDNDLFVVDQVKNHVTEFDGDADRVRYIICPYEEAAIEINPAGIGGVTIGAGSHRFLP